MISAGYAECDITPAPGVPMMGNTRDDYASTGIHDPLLCRALVLKQEDTLIGFLAVDLCMIPPHLAVMIRCGIGKEVPLMICATHTHAGPSVMSIYGDPVCEPEVVDKIALLCARTFSKAAASLEPASLFWGEASCEGISFCRRLQGIDGKTVMNWEMPDQAAIQAPWSSPDQTVHLIDVQMQSARCIMVNFPLHPAILDYGNTLFSKDFPEFLEQGLRRVLPQPVSVMFLNGCCGDVNHINYLDRDAPRRGYAASERVGYSLALAAAQALRDSRKIEDPRLDYAARSISLRRIPVSMQQLDQAEDDIQESGASDGLPYFLRANLLKELARLQDTPLVSSLTLFRIGEIPIFGLPGEVFTDLKQLLCRKTESRQLIAVELVNDALGYIPTEQAYCQGGYETMPGATRIAPGEGEKIIEACLEMYHTLFYKKE